MRDSKAARVALLVILSCALLLRFSDFATLPAGLYYDEAIEGLDALKIISGDRPVYFSALNSRAALFTYSVATSLSLLGRSPAAIRLPAAVASCATVIGVYLLARSLFNRRVGLLAAFASSFSVWMILLGRLGDNPSMSALFLSFGLWLGVRGWQSQKWWCWTLSGIVMGLSIYTYEASRVIILILPLWAVALVLYGQGRRLWPGTLIFVAAFMITVTPLLLYAWGHWSVIVERSEDVSILSLEDNVPATIATLGRQTWSVLQMFVMKSRGDWNWRHNIGGRPVFDPVMAVPFVISLALSLRRRHRMRMTLLSVWVASGLLVTILTNWAPHFRRASAILPVLFIWPAIGMDWVVSQLAERINKTVAFTISGAILAGSAFITTRDLILERHLESTQVVTHFDYPITTIALSVNHFLNVGWQGRGLLVGSNYPVLQRQVWMESSVWTENPVLQFLVPIAPDATAALQILQPDLVLPHDALNDELLLVLHKDTPIPKFPDNYVTIIPHNDDDMIAMIQDGSVVTMQIFPVVPGSSGLKLLLPYRMVGAQMQSPTIPIPPATLGDGLTLMGARLDRQDTTIIIDGLWRVESYIPPPISISAHMYDPGGKFMYANDALDIDPDLWHPNLQFIQRHTLVLPPEAKSGDYHVFLGLYRLDDGRRYTTNEGSDAVEIGMVTVE